MTFPDDGTAFAFFVGGEPECLLFELTVLDFLDYGKKVAKMSQESLNQFQFLLLQFFKLLRFLL